MLVFPIIIILSIDIRGGSLAAYSMFLVFFKERDAEKQTKRETQREKMTDRDTQRNRKRERKIETKSERERQK